MKKTRRMLAVLLALVMVLSGSASAFAAAGTGSAGSESTGGTTVTEIDPSTLNVKKLVDKIDLDVSEPAEKEAKYASDDIVRVSIVLDEKSTIDAGYSVKNYSENKAAKAYRETLKVRQDAVAKEISRKLGKTLDVKWNLTLAVNVISANVLYKDIAAIKLVPGVKDVFIEKQLKVAEVEAGTDTANTSEYMVGATQAWSTGYTGAGQLVAIIDTGIDYTHQAFDEGAFLHAIKELGEGVDLLTETEIPASDLNGNGVYVSAKIPYAYNYKDKTNDLTQLGHTSDTQTNHGSHVAGIAAANRYVPGETEGTYVDAAENTYAVGMAPDAQIVAMKVFGTKGGPYESDYMPAIEDALVLGCASINLSLGSDAEGWTFSQTYQDFLNFLSSNSSIGTILSISAGNSGAFTMYQPYGYLYADDIRTNTVGSPASYINSLAVASANNTGATGPYIEFDTSVKAFYSDTAGEETSFAPMTSIPGSYSYVYIDTIGEAEDLAAVNAVQPLAGKIVMVNRGEINFSDKGNNAWAYGPKAILVANNESGTLNMSLSAYEGTCPMVLIPLDSAKAIKAGADARTADGVTYYTGTAEVINEIYSGPVTDYNESSAEMSIFSGWGVSGSLTLKPEITAPGGSIYSVNGTSISTNDANTGPTSYVNYSGTSMAAPHVTGLTAVLAQYLDENDIAEKNAGLAAGYSRRAIMQSLLMSTAEPLYNSSDNFSYYPVMQQGAGLINVNKAINARSVIMMGQEDMTLTAVTGAAADGKVKAEIGDDLFADKNGARQFSFTIYNLDEQAQEYILETDLFVQGWYGVDEQDNMIAAEETVNIDFDVEYDFEHSAVGNEHDVNGDGKTNKKDAQAVTDYITGIISGSDIDLDAADIDEDGDITSYDAYLILNYSEENSPALIVPAGGSKEVTVTITPDTEIVDYLYNVFPNGFYLEGYTYVASVYYTEDNGFALDMHSIPILGFIGNWTDPSMFDANTLLEAVYGYEKSIELEDGSIYWNYSGNISNYLTLTYNGVPEKFFGNRYILEYDIPYEKFAINSRSVIKSICYNVLRSGGTAGYAVTKLGGEYPEVLDAYIDQAYLYGLWYDESERAWGETETQKYDIDTTPAKLGLSEGDTFRVGYYSMPEYYGIVYNMLVNMYTGNTDPINGTYDGLVDTESAFAALLENEFLGRGAYVGYDFKVDDTAPVIDRSSVTYDPSTGIITFSAEDNYNLAYAAVLSLDGEEAYWELAPGGATVNAEADIINLADQIEGYVALFVADYAGNEAAVALQINDNSSEDPTLVSSITVDPEELDIYKGNKVQLLATVAPLTADQTVTWSSSNESVVTVDEFGEITAVAPGTATITVTSNGDTTKTATCDVTVSAAEKKLNALLMDDNSETFFVSFGADDLPDWGRKHDTALDVNLLNALNSSSALYASTASSQASYVYTVDRDTFEPTLLGENYVPAFDMAPFSLLGTDDTYFIYTYAYYLVFGDFDEYAPEEDGPAYIGFPYMVADLSSFLGEDVWISGVAAKDFSYEVGSTTMDFYGDYYLIDDLGNLWTIVADMTLTFDENYDITGMDVSFGRPKLIMKTGIAATFLYQNLFYDGEYLYWSYYKGNTAHLAVILPDEGKFYDAGDFGKDIWPATGFYMDDVTGSDLEVDSAAAEPTVPMSLKHSAEAATMLADEELRSRVSARIEQAEKQMKAAVGTADQAAGGLDMVKTGVSSKKANAKESILNNLKPAEERVRKVREGAASVKATEGEIYDFVPGAWFDVAIFEEEDVTNGKYEVKYDPERLAFNESYSFVNGDAASINDDGNGTVTIAFADLYPFPAGTMLAYVSFDTVEETGLGAVITTLERNDDLDLNEVQLVATEEYPVTITTCRLELQSKIGIRIYFKAPENAKTAKIFFEADNYDEGKAQTLDLSRVNNPYYSASQDLFVMIFPKITSRQMTMHIRFVVYDENDQPMGIFYPDGGEFVSDYFEYCAADWANRIIRIAPTDSSIPEEAVTMAKSLLAYGGAAQLYLNNYNPDHPANPEGYMAEEMAALQPDPEYNMVGRADAEAVGLSDIRLELAEETGIRLFFNKAVTVKVDGADAKVYKDKNSDTWLVIINGINSRRLNHMYQIEITSAAGTATLMYSALSWANDMIARNIEAAIPTARAMYLYHYAAVAYIK